MDTSRTPSASRPAANILQEAFVRERSPVTATGRGLRRQSYDLNPETGLFDVEYADIMGIPFDFTTSPQVAKPTAPKPVTRVHAIKERAKLEIVFPRVSGHGLRRMRPSRNTAS